MNKFKKMDISKQNEIYGGSFLGVASTMIPLISTGLTAIGSFIKILKTPNGSIKTNDTNISWNNGNNNDSTSTVKNPTSAPSSPSGPTIIAF